MYSFRTFTDDTFGPLRVINCDGELWFALEDVYRITGKADHPQPSKDETSTAIVKTSDGIEEIATISMPGLFILMHESAKAIGKAYKKWITSKVIPESYKKISPSEVVQILLENPDGLTCILEELRKEHAARLRAEKAAARIFAEAGKHMPQVFEMVNGNDESISVNDLAIAMRRSGIDIGPRRFFDYLRREGYLHMRGELRDMPTQYAIDEKLMEVAERSTMREGGSLHTIKTAMITNKGRIFFVSHYMSKRREYNDH